jgi:hypothetical protein
MALSSDEDRRVQEIVRELQQATLGGHALIAVLSRLRRLLEAEKVAAHKLKRTLTGYKAEFLFTEGFAPGSDRVFTEWLATAPQDAFGYDPASPEPAQRNVVLRSRTRLSADQAARIPVVRDLFPKMGLTGLDQIRVLVCDGPKLLAWVGAFRQRSFTENDEQRFAALVPAMKDRLQLEAELFHR